MSARQMGPRSQGKKIIQKHKIYRADWTLLYTIFVSNIFKQVVGRQTQLRWILVKKYIGEIGLERP